MNKNDPDIQNVIKVKHLKNYLGNQWVHEDVNFTVERGEIFCIVGLSGAGKTTALRSILNLLKPTSGEINVLGVDILNCTDEDIDMVRRRCGTLFQQSALFSSMTLLENVMFPLNEFTDFSEKIITELALLKISMVGLSTNTATMMPAELSGGMKKRAALARAIALDPDILFLDEPTTGLDPQGAEALDDLILHLRDNLGLTVMIVTHDLDTLWHIADKVCFLAHGQSLAVMTMDELVKYEHPTIQTYFSGPRGKLRRGGRSSPG